MFKKIEVWILYLTILIFFPFTIFFGFLVRQEIVGAVKFGRISKAALFLADMPSNIKQIFLKQVELNDSFPTLTGFSGIPNSQESYLLFSRYDGNIMQSVIELVDLTNFKVLHTWNPDLDKFNKLVGKNKEFKYLRRDNYDERSIIFHPLLDENGNLYFHRNGTPLVKINQCSQLLFQNTQDNFHHSIEADIDGNLWVPSWIFPQKISIEKVGRKHVKDGGYNDDGITKISPQGDILFEKSISQIFIENGLENLLFAHGIEFVKDPLHLNDIQPVNFDGKYWKKGDVFLSLREQSMVVLYRPSTNKIIWKGTGPFFRQHDIDIIDSNKISIFNNNLLVGFKGLLTYPNEVIIYNFEKDEYTKYLSKELIDNNVSTAMEGRSEILKNGDLYIEESNIGRTLFFNSDGSLRWTHYNRADNGRVYRIGWSRILHKKHDIFRVNNFLKTKSKCDD